MVFKAMNLKVLNLKMCIKGSWLMGRDKMVDIDLRMMF